MKAGELIDGRYEAIRELGRGGMSVVWLALDRDLGKEVAVKVMNSQSAADGILRQRFEREAELHSRVSHGNVVAVQGHGKEASGRPYLVMEYIEGETFRQALGRGLTGPELIEIFDQILCGVGACHAAGVIHRDLKPGNILIGTDGVVRIADFGVASSASGDLSLTESGTVIGTAHYLSPEQGYGENGGELSDLYAVGVMFYESLAGRPPFEGENLVSVLAQQATGPARPPSRFNPEITPEYDRLALRAVAYRPDLRFESAEEFRSALHHPEVLLPARRKRLWPALWLALIVMLVVGAAGAVLLGGEKQPMPELRGKSLQEARSILAGTGTESRTTLRSSPAPAGEVIGQTPSAGEALPEEEPALLLVSSGPAKVAVPETAGLRKGRAIGLLRKSGLKALVKLRPSAAVAGEVTSSRPEAGAEARPGESIVLIVSSGPGRLPDFRGMKASRARAEIARLGASVRISQVASSKPAGIVVAQYPKPGSRIERTVTLRISSGPAGTGADTEPEQEIVYVPDLLGLPASQALRELEQDGLGSILLYVPVSDPGQNRRVLSQSPSSGQGLLGGGEVRLRVGAYSPPPGPPQTAQPSAEEPRNPQAKSPDTSGSKQTA